MFHVFLCAQFGASKASLNLAFLIILIVTFGVSCSKKKQLEKVSHEVMIAQPENGNTALLVVDVQNDFFSSAVHRSNPNFQSNVAGLIEDCRRIGIEVIHINSSFPADISQRLPSMQLLFGANIPCVEGTFGCERVPCAASMDGERVFLKNSFDPFQNGELQAYLQSKKINHLLICGLTTEVCILSTCFGSTNRGVYTTLVEDCAATDNPAVHAFVVNRYRGLIFETIKGTGIPTRVGYWSKRFGAKTPGSLINEKPRIPTT